MNKTQKLSKLTTDWKFAQTAKNDYYMIPGKGETTTVKKEEYFDQLMAHKRWYEGDQWSVYPDGSSMTTTGDIAKPVVNFIKTIIDQKSAMLKKKRTSFDIKPVEKEDTDGSLMLNQLLRFIWKKECIQAKISEAYRESLKFGCGFQKIRYDGKDVKLENISSLNFYPDKFGYEIEDMRFIHIVYEKTAEYLNFHYELKDKEVADEDGKVICYETWYNPCEDYPDGAYFFWTEKQIIKENTLKEICARKPEIPVIIYRYNPSTDNFWGKSAVKDLAQVQMIHNKSLGFILDNLILTNNGQYKTTDDKLPEIMDNTPGKIYHLEDIKDLEPLATPRIDPQWFAIAQYTSYPLFQAMSGTYAVNLGGKSGTDTASGIIALQQAGGTLPESDFVDVQAAARKVAKFILAYMFEYYDEKRIFNVVDKEVPKKSINLDTDIFVDFGDALPDDKISRINLLSQMMQAGAITKPQFIEFLDTPILNNYVEKAQQELKAQQEQMQKDQALKGQKDQQMLQKGQQDIEEKAQTGSPMEKRVENKREATERNLP